VNSALEVEICTCGDGRLNLTWLGYLRRCVKIQKCIEKVQRFLRFVVDVAKHEQAYGHPCLLVS